MVSVADFMSNNVLHLAAFVKSLPVKGNQAASSGGAGPKEVPPKGGMKHRAKYEPCSYENIVFSIDERTYDLESQNERSERMEETDSRKISSLMTPEPHRL